MAFSNKKSVENIDKNINDYLTSTDMKRFYAFKYFNKFEKHDHNSGHSNSNNVTTTDSLTTPLTNEIQTNGWNIYEYFFEYMRMGIELENQVIVF